MARRRDTGAQTNAPLIRATEADKCGRRHRARAAAAAHRRGGGHAVTLMRPRHKKQSTRGLVEQHQLDLDADIQQYLDFDLPKTYPHARRSGRVDFLQVVGITEGERDLAKAEGTTAIIDRLKAHACFPVTDPSRAPA